MEQSRKKNGGKRTGIWVIVVIVALMLFSGCGGSSYGSSSGNSSNQKTAICNYCGGRGKVNGSTCPWCGGSRKTYNNYFNNILGGH